MKCPYCQELIKDGAIKCRYCGEFVKRSAPGRSGGRSRPGRSRPRGRAQTAPSGSGIFVMGLLGILLCGILGPIAWTQGNAYEKRCRSMKVAPDGLASAGKILGMIATLFMFAQVLLVLMWLGVVGSMHMS